MSELMNVDLQQDASISRVLLKNILAFLCIIAGLLFTHAVSHAADPIITASHADRIILSVKGEEISLPIPAGYRLVDYRRIEIKRLPQLQDRKLIAAFEKQVDKSNEYQIEPWLRDSGPLYYLAYIPKLDYATATSDDPLSQLAEGHAAFGIENLGTTQRFAIQRPDDNSLSVTWADLSYYLAPADEAVERPLANCIHLGAYRKGKALLMFDTLESCERDARRVKTHGEAWLQRIADANEPSPYARQMPEAEPEAEPAQEVEKPVETEPAVTKEEIVAAPVSAGMIALWIFLGALLGILLWVSASNLYKSVSSPDNPGT